MELSASKAVRIRDAVVNEMINYAHHCMEWDMEQEDDFERFKEIILDEIMDVANNVTNGR